MASEPADKTHKSPERRTAQRFNLMVTVEYRTTIEREKGLLWDISTSGARIAEASTSVSQGTHVELQFALFPGALPIVLSAEVVRETKTGRLNLAPTSEPGVKRRTASWGSGLGITPGTVTTLDRRA